MTRPILKLAPKSAPSKPIPYSLLRRAVAMYRSEFAPRSVRRKNALNWLKAMGALGDKHVYKGGKEVRWSHPQILPLPRAK